MLPEHIDVTLERCSEGKTGQSPRCRNIAPILQRIGDKWSILIVMILARGPRRFNELKRTIDGISQRMLTVTLRSLEEDGIVIRTIYPEIPPRVEYQLTELGLSLLTQLMELASWADSHSNEIIKARKKYQRRAG